MKKVLVYTTPTCGFCKMTKSFFRENNVAYEEIDVSANNEKAQEMVKRSGQMGVPVVVVTDESGKEDLIVGFDRDRLVQALGLSL